MYLYAHYLVKEKPTQSERILNLEIIVFGFRQDNCFATLLFKEM